MTNGLTDDQIAAFAAQLLDLEDDIEAVQADKKLVYGTVRDAYGKRAADALKLAIKRCRMDSTKIQVAEEIDAEAERFLAVIRAPRAPRATRTRENIEQFDAETGEITETEAPTPLPVDQGQRAVASITEVQRPAEAKTPELEPSSEGSEGVWNGESGHPLTIPEPATPAPQEIAEPGDRGASSLAATVVPTIRPHNPGTHFLNKDNLMRLHGCLNPDMCGSSTPRVKLCWECSVKHDGPAYREGDAA